MSDIVFLLSLLLVGISLLILGLSNAKRAALQIPSGKPIYQDTQETGVTLVSHKHRLKGRPDLLIQQDNVIIPVEIKTGRTPKQPYESHVMQLIAYCILVEEAYSVRPPHGIIRYTSGNFEVAFTVQREAELMAVMADIAKKKQLSEVHRSHSNQMRCAACGFNYACSEKLDSID